MRTKSAVDSALQEDEDDVDNDSPGFFYSMHTDPPRPKAGMPPARELDSVWDMFIEESWRRRLKPQITNKLL